MAKTKGKVSGRSDKRRFAGIPHDVMNHPDWLKLSSSAIRLLLELCKQYNGYNNGDLTAAWSVMHQRGFNSQTTLKAALDCLLDCRFITRTREGMFCNPGKQCALYALNWQPINECKGRGLDVSPTAAPLRSFGYEKKKLSPESAADFSRNWSHPEVLSCANTQ